MVDSIGCVNTLPGLWNDTLIMYGDDNGGRDVPKPRHKKIKKKWKKKKQKRQKKKKHTQRD